jgi:hypothetical protein
MSRVTHVPMYPYLIYTAEYRIRGPLNFDPWSHLGALSPMYDLAIKHNMISQALRAAREQAQQAAQEQAEQALLARLLLDELHDDDVDANQDNDDDDDDNDGAGNGNDNAVQHDARWHQRQALLNALMRLEARGNNNHNNQEELQRYEAIAAALALTTPTTLVERAMAWFDRVHDL